MPLAVSRTTSIQCARLSLPHWGGIQEGLGCAKICRTESIVANDCSYSLLMRVYRVMKCFLWWKSIVVVIAIVFFFFQVWLYYPIFAKINQDLRCPQPHSAPV